MQVVLISNDNEKWDLPAGRPEGNESWEDDGEPDTPFRRKCRMTWAALIRAIFEVEPLKCPSCGGNMKIVSLIEEESIIEKILRHCNLWKEEPPRSPPQKIVAENICTQPVYDYSFMEPA